MESNKRSTHEAGAFVKGLRESSVKSGTFDSAAADDFMAIALNQSIAGVKVPDALLAVLDEAGEDNRQFIHRAILDGANEYEARHGCPMPADVAEYGFHLAYGLTTDGRKEAGTLDSTSMHADNLSLQPNRAVVAIMSAFSEAIPFAHYLPADISSNEAKLAIMVHVAGDTFGEYAQNGVMDASYSGKRYVSSVRTHKCTVSAVDGTVTGKLTKVQTNDETCDSNGGAVKLMRGRTQVYVNGQLAAVEISKVGSGTSAVSGSINVSGTEYQIGGTINTDTGDIAMTTTPKLPVANEFHVRGFIDYERDPSITPSIITNVDMYSLFASPWRVLTRVTPDSRTQMSAELGLDPYSESIIAINAQVANERHFDSLSLMMRIAKQNQIDFNFDWANQGAQKTRAQVFQEFAATIGIASQVMAIATMNHGITHLYGSKKFVAFCRLLPAEIFQSSGISDRPGIFRAGRLFGLYDVYYSPNMDQYDTATATKVLSIGKATDVTRNPVVLGDAAPAVIKPLAMGGDLNEGAGYYARSFTELNPHGPSAKGAALINIINMPS